MIYLKFEKELYFYMIIYFSFSKVYCTVSEWTWMDLEVKGVAASPRSQTQSFSGRRKPLQVCVLYNFPLIEWVVKFLVPFLRNYDCSYSQIFRINISLIWGTEPLILKVIITWKLVTVWIYFYFKILSLLFSYCYFKNYLCMCA